MIASVFTPNGIVVATASYDSFLEYVEYENDTVMSPINIEGLTHTYLFYRKYSLTFNVLSSQLQGVALVEKFEDLSQKWNFTPPIVELMPYLKKLLVDNHIQLIGIVAGYDKDKNGKDVPYVYQILGKNIRRINIDNEGRINYNCVYLEKYPIIGKLLQQTKIKNGDIWEECSDIKLRCDLYSIKKSLELCQFLIRTNHYVGNINSNSYKCPLKADISIITKENVEVKLIDI